MSNPWSKKDPWLSLWLTGANTIASTARSHVGNAAKRQSTAAMNKAVSDMTDLWTAGWFGVAKPKRRRRR
jgi:hypothetical protein